LDARAEEESEERRDALRKAKSRCREAQAAFDAMEAKHRAGGRAAPTVAQVDAKEYEANEARNALEVLEEAQQGLLAKRKRVQWEAEEATGVIERALGAIALVLEAGGVEARRRLNAAGALATLGSLRPPERSGLTIKFPKAGSSGACLLDALAKAQG